MLYIVGILVIPAILCFYDVSDFDPTNYRRLPLGLGVWGALWSIPTITYAVYFLERCLYKKLREGWLAMGICVATSVLLTYFAIFAVYLAGYLKLAVLIPLTLLIKDFCKPDLRFLILGFGYAFALTAFVLNLWVW